MSKEVAKLIIRKGYDEIIIKSFKLPVELVDRLDTLASKNKLTLTQLVIQCLEFAVNNIEEEDPKK